MGYDQTVFVTYLITSPSITWFTCARYYYFIILLLSGISGMNTMSTDFTRPFSNGRKRKLVWVETCQRMAHGCIERMLISYNYSSDGHKIISKRQIARWLVENGRDKELLAYEHFRQRSLWAVITDIWIATNHQAIKKGGVPPGWSNIELCVPVTNQWTEHRALRPNCWLVDRASCSASEFCAAVTLLVRVGAPILSVGTAPAN